MTDQIDELSNSTLQSVAKKRAEQSKEAGGIGINNPTRAKAMDLLRKSDNAKYRHTEHPSKVTPKTPPPAPTEADKAAHAKANKAKVDSQNNRGYGEGRYMGDSVEQEEVIDQLDEVSQNSYFKTRKDNEDRISGKLTTKPRKISQNSYFKTRKDHEDKVSGTAKANEEVESLDELSMDTVKSYKEKVAKNPAPSKTTPNILHKAIRRFAGKERAEDRIHSDEMKKMRERLGLKNEEVLDENDGIHIGARVYHKEHKSGEPHKVTGIVDDQRVKVKDEYGNTKVMFIHQLTPAKMNEETLDELDQSTLASYKKKASFDVRSANATIGSFDKSPEQKDAAAKVRTKRSKGLFASVRKMAGRNESVESLDEGKFLETHKGEDAHGVPKPNPKHPAYATHKKAYDAKVAERKATTFGLKSKEAKPKTPTENPVKMHHIDSAISNSFPDVEPYEHLKRQFPHLHKEDHPTHGTKLTYWADKAVAAHDKKHKSLSSYADAAYKDMHDDKMMGEDAAQKNMTNAMDTIDPVKRDAARKQYKAARDHGMNHASSLSLMHQRFGKANEEVDEGVVSAVKKGIKYVKRGMQGWGTLPTTDLDGNNEGPKGLVKRNKGYDDETVKSLSDLKNRVAKERPDSPHSPSGLQQRVLDREMKKRGLTSEEVKTEKPGHKVGDTVWAASPTNKALTMTGKVTKIGQTLTTVQHKDGSEAHYPHKLVNNDYEVLHPTPKKWQREHLEQTGELLSLAEVKYMIENASGGVGAIAQHAGVNGAAPQGTGKVKKMMGNKTDAAAIAKIIVNGAKSKEERN